jgi:uncharacterized protein YjiS (DUF1127 family)
MWALRLNPVARLASGRGVGARLDDVLRLLLDWSERRRQRIHLSALPDHMLKDIGVSSADAAREAGKPFWER